MGNKYSSIIIYYIMMMILYDDYKNKANTIFRNLYFYKVFKTEEG